MEFTHIDGQGNAIMVDVGEKTATFRKATATGSITLSPEAFALVRQGHTQKGDVLTVAQLAGIMATKHTSDLIPLCHRLNLSGSEVNFRFDEEKFAIWCTCTVKCQGPTGVEMEALTGVSCGLLTIYDMCKSVDRSMVMSNIHLLEKEGGKSGHYLWKEPLNEG